VYSKSNLFCFSLSSRPPLLSLGQFNSQWFLVLFIYLFLEIKEDLFFYFIVFTFTHMCIHWLDHLPPCPPPHTSRRNPTGYMLNLNTKYNRTLSMQTPHGPAETRDLTSGSHHKPSHQRGWAREQRPHGLAYAAVGWGWEPCGMTTNHDIPVRPWGNSLKRLRNEDRQDHVLFLAVSRAPTLIYGKSWMSNYQLDELMQILYKCTRISGAAAWRKTPGSGDRRHWNPGLHLPKGKAVFYFS
jgi:hypothetical protein